MGIPEKLGPKGLCLGGSEKGRGHEGQEENTLKGNVGISGWLIGLAPAFGPERDPGVPGLSPTSGFCMEPASPSACVSAFVSPCLS